jgi:type IV secretion system protein VirB9
MKKIILSLALASLIPSLAIAQQVPAIDNGNIRSTYGPSSSAISSLPSSYGTIPVLSNDSIRLNQKQKQAVNLSNQWANAPVMPTRGENGTVDFTFGATMPSVICAPQHVCDIALQEGETVTQLDIGDASRWKVNPATSGTGQNSITHLVVKAADVGLQTNLLVHTDRRTYNITLVSKRQNQTPMVAFNYPDDTQRAWSDYYKAHSENQNQEPESLRGNVRRAQSASVSNSTLDFAYKLKGDSPTWKPIRVYADHNKTYIQFPEKSQNREIPALVILGEGNKEQLVNYRMVNDRFVVDKIIDKAALITGVGRRQQRVEIERGS